MSPIVVYDTRIGYLALLGVVILERLIELLVARRNEAWVRARGAVEVGAGHYPFMVVQHAAFLVACPLEVWFFDRPFIPVLGFSMLAVLIGTMVLRYWTVRTLGNRWTTRILCVPGLPPVTGGPFRFLRHPNYVAVIFEIAALPLIHSAWVTALVFSVANGFLLRIRIRTEERALEEYNHYLAEFQEIPRMVPR